MAGTGKRLLIKLVRSPFGRIPAQRRTVRALGLGKMNSTTELEASPAVMGMIAAVSHLVEVKELS